MRHRWSSNPVTCCVLWRVSTGSYFPYSATGWACSVVVSAGPLSTGTLARLASGNSEQGRPEYGIELKYLITQCDGAHELGANRCEGCDDDVDNREGEHVFSVRLWAA